MHSIPKTLEDVGWVGAVTQAGERVAGHHAGQDESKDKHQGHHDQKFNYRRPDDPDAAQFKLLRD